jgi:hypothetical protein
MHSMRLPWVAVLLLVVSCMPVGRPQVAWPAPLADADGAWVCPSKALEPRHEPTLFVSIDGSDDHDGRSEDMPLRTVQRAADLVQPGDVVWVRGGVYASDVVFEQSGSIEAPIVFESYPGECAVFDGAGLEPLQRLQFWDVQHVVFRNFVVRNSPGEGIFLSRSHRNVISHVLVLDNRLSGILAMLGDENLFSHVISHGNFDRPLGADADGISIASGHGNRVDRCVVFDNSDDGVDTWLSTNTLVERCVSFDNGRGLGDGNGFKLGGGERVTSTVVRHSIAFANRADGFDWNSGKNVTFEHNTAYGNGRFGFLAGAARLVGNLAVGNGAAAFRPDRGANVEVANSWNLGVHEVDFVTTDPGSTDFLRLLAPVRGAEGVGRSAAGVWRRGLGAMPVGGSIASALGIGWWPTGGYEGPTE